MAAPGVRFLSFGEALLRFAPANGREEWRGQPSAVSPFVRSVGGDELNVCVALARLGRDAAFVSVLPAGPLGDVVRTCAQDAGVQLSHLRTAEEPDSELGVFYVLPEESRVHYQRRNSAFCRQPPGLFAWESIVAERSAGGASPWLHLTGITPMLSDQAAESWRAAVRAADAARVPVSVDLNWRPQLGTFDKLWSIVGPEISKVHLLILSAQSAAALEAHLTKGSVGEPAVKPKTEEETFRSLAGLHKQLGGPALACCLKDRAADGQQRRWSVIVDAAGSHSTEATPTLHRPRDECGGGSAWAAGVIDALSGSLREQGRPLPDRQDGVVVLAGAAAAARRGDILAALAQESIGDHSTATQADLSFVEDRFRGAAAIIDGLPTASGRVPAPLADAAASPNQRLQTALQRLENAKVIAIIRAKNEARTIERAVELADMGFRAIEVTADSAGFVEGRLLPAVVKAVGHRCLVGVGTITTVAQLEQSARFGAQFALSPVRPTAGWEGTDGFVGECHKRGILAMPAAYSPQEIYECVETHGALTVKVFPAQLWSPSTLKDLLRIGTYGSYRLCPSGGIDCSNAEAWLAAGATAVGMGSCLVGKDTATLPSDAAAMAAAEEDWRTTAKPNAMALAARLSLAPAPTA